MLELIKIKTRCMYDFGCTHTVYIYKSSSTFDGVPVYLPNGCDFYNGSSVCLDCNFALRKMLENGFIPLDHLVVSPDLSLLK